MDTNGCNGLNGDRVGRTNLHECNEFFIYMSYGVLPFFEIFDCARHSPNKFGSALACAKICFEIFGCARQSSNKFDSALACAKIREISATDQVAILLVERN